MTHVLIALAMSAAPSFALQIQPQPKLLAPPLMINEVMFDPIGTDAHAKMGSEWVELYAAQAVQLDRYKLADNFGNVLGTLPTASIPAGSYIQITLGGSPSIVVDQDPTDGAAGFMLGLPPGDLLGNASGGVRLLNRAGAIVDCVYWGTGSAPVGAQGGNWTAGTFIDLSYSAKPINEGDSIGRSTDPAGDFTGKKADWDINGGVNAAGPTPKARNGVEKADRLSLLKWSQAGVNDVITGYGTMVQPGWFSFTNSAVSVISENQQTNSYTFVAHHTFTVLVYGQPTTLAGDITASYARNETPGSVGYSLSAVANLSSDSGYGFDITYSEQVSGFHGASHAITATCSTDVTYTEFGSSYDFDNSAVTTLTRTGQNTWTLDDSRSATDYGGAGLKQASSQNVVTRTSDGAYHSSFTLTRDYPIAPPPPGSTDSIQFQETDVAETTSTCNDLGEYSTRISRMDSFRNGAPFGGLQAGATGVASLVVNAATPSTPFGSATYQATLPLVDQFGSPMTFNCTVSGSTDFSNSNMVSTVTNTILLNGSSADSFSYYIDPPVCLQSSPSGGASGSQPEGFLDAVVDCSWKGGAVGAGAGVVVGGVAGAIGGSAVGGAIGALGGPPGMVAAGTAGGYGGAAAGAFVGTGAGAVIGTGVGAVACGCGWLWHKIF